jgi:hypothetical protein
MQVVRIASDAGSFLIEPVHPIEITGTDAGEQQIGQSGEWIGSRDRQERQPAPLGEFAEFVFSDAHAILR